MKTARSSVKRICQFCHIRFENWTWPGAAACRKNKNHCPPPITHCPLIGRGKIQKEASLPINGQCVMGGGQCWRQALYLDVFDISKLALPPHRGLNGLKQLSKVIAQISRHASGA